MSALQGDFFLGWREPDPVVPDAGAAAVRPLAIPGHERARAAFAQAGVHAPAAVCVLGDGGLHTTYVARRFCRCGASCNYQGGDRDLVEDACARFEARHTDYGCGLCSEREFRAAERRLRAWWRGRRAPMKGAGNGAPMKGARTEMAA